MDKEELKQIYASIHTLRMEGDQNGREAVRDGHPFQSTPSAWRVTRRFCDNPKEMALFQSTPSAWRVTFANILHNNFIPISIHTLRVEGDQCSS